MNEIGHPKWQGVERMKNHLKNPIAAAAPFKLFGWEATPNNEPLVSSCLCNGFGHLSWLSWSCPVIRNE